MNIALRNSYFVGSITRPKKCRWLLSWCPLGSLYLDLETRGTEVTEPDLEEERNE